MAVLAELSWDGGTVSEAFMQDSSIDAGTVVTSWLGAWSSSRQSSLPCSSYYRSWTCRKSNIFSGAVFNIFVFVAEWYGRATSRSEALDRGNLLYSSQTCLSWPTQCG